jgi:hypothetical protein
VADGETQPLSKDQAALIAAWNGKTWQVLKADAPACGTLITVSCPAANGCVALGNYSESAASPADTLNLAETWNGKSWKMTPKSAAPTTTAPPKPFAALSRVSASRCIGVGTVYNSSYLPSSQFAEAWTESAWKALATGTPSHVCWCAPIMGQPDSGRVVFAVWCKDAD